MGAIYVTLSEQEKLARLIELADVSDEIADIEEQKSTVMKNFRETLKERKQRAADLRTIIRTGEEKRDTQISLGFDPGTNEVIGEE